MAERAIGAPATQVYRLIADFDRHHPRFLPSALTGFRVEEGGVDAGDRAQLPDERWRAGPRFPHAGRGAGPRGVLTESDQGSSMMTTWVVTPEGPGCRVRVEIHWQGAGGSVGCSSGCSRHGCCGGCTLTNWSGWTATSALHRPTERSAEQAVRHQGERV